MSKTSLLILILFVALSLTQLCAQEFDGGYEEGLAEVEEPATSAAGNRVPMLAIAVIIALIAAVMYHYILHKRFIEYLDQRMSPQSAAATCLLQWLSWVFLLILLFVGLDVVNMDFLNVGEHLSSALLRIIVIVVLYFALFMAISPYKRKQVN